MKKSYRRVALMLVVTILMVTNTVGATDIQDFGYTSEDEIVISSEVLSNAQITKESDSVITVTSVSTSILPQTRAANTAPLYANDVEVMALLVNDPSKTDEIYQDLLVAGDEASSYRTKSDYVVGMTIYCTVY